jgi:hypothetical protein
MEKISFGHITIPTRQIVVGPDHPEQRHYLHPLYWALGHENRKNIGKPWKLMVSRHAAVIFTLCNVGRLHTRHDGPHQGALTFDPLAPRTFASCTDILQE